LTEGQLASIRGGRRRSLWEGVTPLLSKKLKGAGAEMEPREREAGFKKEGRGVFMIEKKIVGDNEPPRVTGYGGPSSTTERGK